ncbi:HEAT repeat protein [Ureibacillus xyleni]|uniref:HEAT repeat protein n=1 Tax=Ureibacillus xyleni TaxID=614648 RepID=A0A285SP07_9BACL|nr:HEAT repeat domain-containing protein [Ureibacillus xyleni]SOC09527.1 HEAT repeat protein [Ureibacillus xyleni]
MFNQEILFLSILNLVLFVGLISLLGYLVIRKFIEIKHQNQLADVKNKLQPSVINYLLEGYFGNSFTFKKRVYLQAMEELFVNYAEVLTEEKVKMHILDFADHHFKHIYVKNLSSRRWSTRMNTLYYIEELGMESLIPTMLNRMDHRKTSQTEKVQMLRILATFQHPKIVEYVSEFNFMSDSDYKGILLKLNHQLLDLLFLNYHQHNAQLKYALLDVIYITSNLQYIHLVEDIFKHSIGEERIRSYKALVKLGYAQDINKFIPLVHSMVWEERMLTAKLLGTVKEQQYLPALRELLRDPIWWVRTQAGHAIASYPNSTEILQDVVQTEQDQFAKDLALEWLQKGVKNENARNHLE